MTDKKPNDPPPNVGQDRASSFSAPDPSLKTDDAPAAAGGPPAAPAKDPDPVKEPEAVKDAEPSKDPAPKEEKPKNGKKGKDAAPAATSAAEHAPAAAPVDTVLVELQSSGREVIEERRIPSADRQYRLVVDGSYYDHVGTRADGVWQYARH